MNKLKPCPFCGEIPQRTSTKYSNGKIYWWVRCENEKCLVQPITAAYTCKGADIRAWNRRANE